MTLTLSRKAALLFLIVIPVLGGTLLFIAKKAHPHFIKVFDEYDEDDNRIYGGRTYEGVFDCSGMSTITTSVWIRSGSSRWGSASFQITDVE